jgi:hypothetical protein
MEVSMAVRVVRGELVGIVDGPGMILNVNGEEQKFGLAVDLSLGWISAHMGTDLLVKVEDNRVTEIV